MIGLIWKNEPETESPQRGHAPPYQLLWGCKVTHWGQKLANDLPVRIRWIKKVAAPGALLGAICSYFLIANSLSFALIVCLLLLLTGADEYWRARKILESSKRLDELSEIEGKREAHVFVYGGLLRELKYLVVITLAVV
jgi:hypothetical protein